jgi:hypothetical protein
MSNTLQALTAMTRGCYDLQQLRIQAGLRLYANFRAQLKDPAEEGEEVRDELSAEAERLLTRLKASHHRLTDSIARNRTLPAREGFSGDELISSYAELVLVDEYFALEKEETRQFRLLTGVLEDIPIYQQYLRHQRGIGPALAAVLISRLDPHKARHPSSFWKFTGLDVGPDGRGRSRSEAHLVDREYVDKNGEVKTRRSITFDPWLKAKLLGVLATSFLRLSSPWTEQYRNYKHRIETDPNRRKATSEQWKKAFRAKEDVSDWWTPKRIHNAAARYMVKIFLADLWKHWRALEGLPVTPTYEEARRGYGHGQEAAE